MKNATECENPAAVWEIRMVQSLHEYVLDLSISLRTGEETNMDFCSSGERTRSSPSGNPSGVVYVHADGLERQARAGDSPGAHAEGRVVLFGSAA